MPALTGRASNVDANSVENVIAFPQIGPAQILHSDDRHMRDRPDLGMCFRLDSITSDDLCYALRLPGAGGPPRESNFLACNGRDFRCVGCAKSLSAWQSYLASSPHLSLRLSCVC